MAVAATSAAPCSCPWPLSKRSLALPSRTQLRELIQTEQAEREALLQAFRENQKILERLRRTNAELLAELARLRQSHGHQP